MSSPTSYADYTVDEDMCGACGLPLNDGCECCLECERHHDDCQCQRCPDCELCAECYVHDTCQPDSSPDSCTDYNGVSYRDAAIALWGEAGAYCHDRYDEYRKTLYPELPDQLPIVIGITAYGHCNGLTRGDWQHGPRISVFSRMFYAEGLRAVDDLLRHELLHAWLRVTGRNPKHDGEDWYAAVRRLSPQVLGRELDIKRGAARKSMRVPNPAYEPGVDDRKTLVRKVRNPDAIEHDDVARWPHSFRPPGYDWGPTMRCPTY